MIEIAIPTYNRPVGLRNKTLKFLENQNIPKKWITIFYASETQKVLYELPNYRGVVGVLGLANQRNFIKDHYPEGTLTLNLDDDVTQIKGLVEGKLRKINLKAVITKAKRLMKKHNLTLLGISPVAYSKWMKQEYCLGSVFILGTFYFEQVMHVYYLPKDFNDKEDVLRSCIYSDAKLGIGKLHCVAIETKFYQPGGYLSECTMEERMERDNEAALLIAAK